MDLSEILNRRKGKEDFYNDDIRVIRSYVEYGEDNKTLKYMIYELEMMDRTGELRHFYKVLKFVRIIRLPKSAKLSDSFMMMHSQLLSGVWEREINFITVIANMISPVPLGLLFLYGVQGVAEDLDNAKRITNNDFAALSSMLQGTYGTLEFRLLNSDEIEWLREKMYGMKNISVVRGLPAPRNGGVSSGDKGFGGSSNNVDAQDTTEEFIAGMSDREYLIEILSTPVGETALRDWLTQTAKEMTRWNGQLQGQKAMNFGISLPMMYMANLGASNGWTHSYTDAQNIGAAQGHTIGQGINESISGSQSHSVGSSYGQNVGSNQGVSSNASVGNNSGISHSDGQSASSTVGHTDGTSYGNSQGQSVSSSHSQGTSESYGSSESHSVSNGVTQGTTVGSSHGVTNGQSQTASQTHSYGTSNGGGNSWGQSQGTSHSDSGNVSVGLPTGIIRGGKGVSDGTSAGANFGGSSSHSASESSGASVSNGITSGESFSNSNSQSLSHSNSVSNGTSLSNSQGTTQSWANSQGSTIGQSFGASASNSASNSRGSNVSDGISAGVSASQGQGQSAGVSQGYSASGNESYSSSNGWSSGKSQSISDSVTNSSGQSHGTSDGSSGAFTQGSSATMGVGPSMSFSKSFQWLDQEVQNIITLLEFQNERLMKALNGNGAFFTDMYIATPDEETKSAAQALAKSTWYNSNALICPLQVMDLSEEEQSHLLYHFNAFSADTTLEGIPGEIASYRYTTILLPEEFVAYTHLPRISEGGIFADVQDIPKFSVPSMRKGEIYMGKILSGERYTQKWGYVTPFDFRLSSDEIMHGFFTGESRSGKTVAATRFVAELANKVRRSGGKRFRIVCMDPKQDWRILAKFVEPERFHFYSLGNPEFLPINLNICKIPHNVYPQQWVDGIIEIYCRAYGLGERGKSVLSETFFKLYEEAGVFVPNWRDVAPERSKQVTLVKICERMMQIKVDLEDPKKSGKGKVGNDVRDAYARVLDRLQVFCRPFSIESQLFGREDGVGIDDLIGGDDVVVLESYGLESTFKNFIFGAITSGFFKYAQAHEGGFKAPDQYETILVIEEANEVLTGQDSADKQGGSPLTGQSEFEKILDQSAGLGLFIFSITQKIASMPSSVIANSGLVFAGKISREEDVKIVIRKIGREERFDDRDLVKWFPRSPIGWFVCRSSRNYDFKEVEPVLVKIEPLDVKPPTNEELLHIMALKVALKQQKEQS